MTLGNQQPPGELREDTGSPLTYVTVVTEGLALNEPDLVPLTVLQHLIGMAPHTKYPTASTNNLYKSAFNVARSPFAVSLVRFLLFIMVLKPMAVVNENTKRWWWCESFRVSVH